MKRYLLLIPIFLILSAVPSWASVLYWYGGDGNWSAATGHWSTNSGNVPDADHIAPVAADTVVTDSLSNATGYTITIDVAAVCAGMTLGAPASGNLTIVGSASKIRDLTLGGNSTIAGTPIIGGNSSINRLYIRSSVKGTPRTITVATSVAWSNVDFQDTTLSPAVDLSAITGLSGDCGGNSGITFTTPVLQYYYKASGNDSVSTVGNWYLGTGGTGGAGRVPLPQDNPAILDDLSFGAASMTLTQDMPRIPGVTFAGVDGLHPVANTPTFTPSTLASVFGGLTLVSGMTLTASTQTYIFEGRGAYTLTNAGKTWAKIISVVVPTGSLTLQDALTITSGYLSVNGGNFNDNGLAFTTPSVLLGNTAIVVRSITLSGMTTLTGYDAILSIPVWWGSSAACTITVTGTIKFTDTSGNAKTFTGAGFSYNNLQFSGGSGGGSYIITGTNTFTGTLTDDGTAAHSITFPNVDTTVRYFVRAPGTNVITFQRTGASGGFTLVKTGGGIVDMDYLSISNSTASPANTWYAGKNSTDGGGNSGWLFQDPTRGVLSGIW